MSFANRIRVFRLRSLAGRIVVLTTFAVALAVTAIAFAAYFTVHSQAISALDDSLHGRAHRAAQSADFQDLAADDIPGWAWGVTDVQVFFIDTNTIPEIRASVRSDVLSVGVPELDVARGEAASSARTVHAHGADYRMVSVSAGKGKALVLAQSLVPTENMLSHLRLVLLAFGLVGVVLAGAAGFIVARDGLTPLRRLTASVDKIGRTGQAHTIPVGGHDEVAQLATAFNTMITALDASQLRQRELVADASHELRTPLTSMRTNLDLLAQSEGRLPDTVRQEILDDVRGQVNEMTALIGDLVELARDTPAQVSSEDLDFAEIVEAALVRVRRRASHQEFEVHLEPWPIEGDASAVERAVTNLLDNAVKWSPDAGRIQVHLHDGTLMVIDEGPGIDDADMPRVFDRFYRAASSRSMPGSGLGLAIVAEVARRHGGAVRVGRGSTGGAALSLSLPQQPQIPAPDGS